MPYKPLKYIPAKGKTRESLIREQVPPHSKVPTENWYNNFDNIKWDSKNNVKKTKRSKKN